MAKLTELNLNTFVRGDSSVLRWSWKKQNSDGTTSALSLVGYKVALTVKASQFDMDEQDSSASEGYKSILWKTDIDCDDSSQMHGLNPANGQVIFPISKQATWLPPNTYYLDIVVENKASHRTQTVAYGKLTIQGHPTNRLTTDEADTFTDITG